MLQGIINELYVAAPERPLYHYTSLQGLLSIVRSKVLWASEVHYLNDAEELKCFAHCISAHISRRLESEDANAAILRQFREWLAGRMSCGPMIFTASFTENGNLLSQWRGYCPPGKGVSIAFEPAALASVARQALFIMGRCIYDAEPRMAVAGQVLDYIVAEAAGYAPKQPPVTHQSHYGLFQDIEPAFLQIAVLMKNPAFQEEQEWRLVSPVHSNYVEPPILYREGAFSLRPYIEFALPLNSDGALAIRRTIVGPSPNANLSLDAISHYLSKAGVRPSEVHNSCIPYRQTYVHCFANASRPSAGSDGTPTSKAGASGAPWLAGSMTIGMIFSISTKLPGQPWVRISGMPRPPASARWRWNGGGVGVAGGRGAAGQTGGRWRPSCAS